jgi:phosphate:Na+ symporter
MFNVIAGFLGGMGLFFMGLKLSGNGVRAIVGYRFRSIFLTWTRTRLSGLCTGVAAGLAFQSTSAISLLLASFVGAGTIGVVQALPVMAGANIGSAFLVLMAVLDIRVLALLLLGMSGLIITFEKPLRLVHAANIFFGVGLLLFGLGIVRTSCSPLAETEWFRAFVSSQGLPLPFYLLIGMAACLLLQTSAGVSILAITLAASGIMDGDDALAVIFGSLFGSSLLSRFYSFQMKGQRKLLVMGQVFFNFVGLLIFLPPFFIEHYTGLPLLLKPLTAVFPDLPERLTAINIAFDTLAALVVTTFLPAYHRLLSRLCPEEPDSLEGLAYARELAHVSPETALSLINKEQMRLARHLPGFTASLRRALDRCESCNLRDLSQDGAGLLDQIDGCLLELVTRGRADGVASPVAQLQDIQGALRGLFEGLAQLVTGLDVKNVSPGLARLRSMFMEALDALLLQTRDVLSGTDADDWELLLTMLKDRERVMEGLRAQYLSGGDALPPDDQWRFLQASGLFERCVWLLRHLTRQQHRFLTEMGDMTTAHAGPPAPAT